MFVFGHTHTAFLKRVGPSGKVVLNTGTWLKLLSRIPVRFGLLPAVYYPSYRSITLKEKTSLFFVRPLFQCTQLVERLYRRTDLLTVLGIRVHVLNPVHQRGILGAQFSFQLVDFPA